MITKTPSNSNVLPSPFLLKLMSQYQLLPLLAPGLCAQQQKDGVGNVCTDEPCCFLCYKTTRSVKAETCRRAGPLHRVQGVKNKVESLLCSAEISSSWGKGGRSCPCRWDAGGKQVCTHNFQWLVVFSGQGLEMRSISQYAGCTHPRTQNTNGTPVVKPQENNPWVFSLSTSYKGKAP